MIAVGVDTHKNSHVAVALDRLGELLGELTITANVAGYAKFVAWVEGFGSDVIVGIEGAGSWGAGLCEQLLARNVTVYEVERPVRRARRSGKSDLIDALAAAKAVLVGERLSTPRSRGVRQALAAMLVAYRSCIGERTRLLNEIQALNATAPITLRERIGEGNGKQLERRLSVMRARSSAPADERAVFAVMRDLATRSHALAVAARRYERELAALVRSLDRDAPPGARRRPDLGSKAPGLRPDSLQVRGSVRALQRNRADAGLLGQDGPLPSQPRRRPPGQQRDPHDRPQPLAAPPRDPRIPRPSHQRGKDQARGDALHSSATSPAASSNSSSPCP